MITFWSRCQLVTLCDRRPIPAQRAVKQAMAVRRPAVRYDTIQEFNVGSKAEYSA